MKFEENKKKSINNYILEKISQGVDGISKCVSEAFSINQNTVHTYINKLVDNGIIEREKRGKYRLVNQVFSYHLKRSEGHLNTDTYAFDACLERHISDFPDNVRRIWSYTFSEMINNVMDHSAAENLEIIIEQNFLNTMVVIKDDGVGIFNKIKEHFDLPSLEEAICELFKGKLTTDSENHSGEGIFFSSKMMDEFFILSSGKIFAANKYDDSQIVDILNKSFPGTCVVMTLANNSHKQTYEIFDLYANVEGGFTKTRIPLKNIFESSPVSRSQAKRVCHRLDKFQEVIIDFEDMDWMGQGFAHQVFVVFQNQHPDIKLVPVNMNEAVTKMWNHVISSNNV